MNAGWTCCTLELRTYSVCFQTKWPVKSYRTDSQSQRRLWKHYNTVRSFAVDRSARRSPLSVANKLHFTSSASLWLALAMLTRLADELFVSRLNARPTSNWSTASYFPQFRCCTLWVHSVFTLETWRWTKQQASPGFSLGPESTPLERILCSKQTQVPTRLI